MAASEVRMQREHPLANVDKRKRTPNEFWRRRVPGKGSVSQWGRWRPSLFFTRGGSLGHIVTAAATRLVCGLPAVGSGGDCSSSRPMQVGKHGRPAAAKDPVTPADEDRDNALRWIGCDAPDARCSEHPTDLDKRQNTVRR